MFSLSVKWMVLLGNCSFLNYVVKLTDLTFLATIEIDCFFLQKFNSLPVKEAYIVLQQQKEQKDVT
jgi:hypothetical protein